MTTPFRSGQRLTAAQLNALFPDTVKLDEQSPTGATCTFSSISQSYRHLLIVGSARGTTAASFVSVTMQLNGDGTAIYDHQQLTGNNAVVAAAESINSVAATVCDIAAASASSGANATIRLSIPNYRGTSFWKHWDITHSLSTGTGTNTLHTKSWAGRYRSTNPITSIVLTVGSGNFATGSLFTLYGLLG